jgi:hypothetical protein
VTDPDSGYADYLKAWQVYLEAIRRAHYVMGGGDHEGRHRAFLDRLKAFVRPNYKVAQWPEVWPNVSWLFGGRDEFTRAVRSAKGDQP